MKKEDIQQIKPEKEELHHLEKKYGKEPKITNLDDLWSWH